MNWFFLLATIDLVSAQACASLWSQCGGRGYGGPLNCCGDSICNYENDYYSQCIPNPSSSPQKVTSDGCAMWWGQCGGLTHRGPTCCAAGSECIRHDEWYSECRPKENSGSCASTWSQCGGKDYRGPTCCQEGTKCTFVDQYYSQCQQIVDGKQPKTTAKASSSLAMNTNQQDQSSKSQPTVNKMTPVNKMKHVHTDRPRRHVHKKNHPVTTAVGGINQVHDPNTNTDMNKDVNDNNYSYNNVSTEPDYRNLTFKAIPGGKTGVGHTTRYWDCCKPSCSWAGKANVTQPVFACEHDGITVVDIETESACEPSGSAYACTDQQPFAINATLAFGFAAATIEGYTEENQCCSCMLLTFTDGAAAGRQMVTQIINTGATLYGNHFDIALPGGGVGVFQEGCQRQYGVEHGWGPAYGGIEAINDCSSLPKDLQPGCEWRWDFLDGGDNPNVVFQEIECPSEIVEISGCQRL